MHLKKKKKVELWTEREIFSPAQQKNPTQTTPKTTAHITTKQSCLRAVLKNLPGLGQKRYIYSFPIFLFNSCPTVWLLKKPTVAAKLFDKQENSYI